VSAPRGNDRETGCARPVHQVANERRLITVREAVHDPRLTRFLRENRAAESIGLHRHHYDVLAVAKRGQRVLHCGDRVAGRFDDDVDPGMRDERLPVLGQVRAALLQGRVERTGGMHPGSPAHSLQVCARVRRGKVGNAGKMHAGRFRHLRAVHRREFARPDQAETQRLPLRFPLLQQTVEIHLTPP